MNKHRRKAIDEIISKLESLKEEIEFIREEEQEYIDNMPESLQGSEKASAAEASVGDLDYAETAILDCIEQLENSKNN